MFPKMICGCLVWVCLGVGVHAVELGRADPLETAWIGLVPQEGSRPWRTDHAGVSPYTIEAGCFEASVELVRYGYLEGDTSIILVTGGPGPGGPGGAGGVAVIPAHQRIETWAYGAMLLKAGLLKNLDLEVGLVPWTTTTRSLQTRRFALASGGGVQIIPAISDRDTFSGFGDTVGALKLNVWGNDGGRTSLALSGTIKFPTAESGVGNRRFEGGPGIDFLAELPWAFEMRINSSANLFQPTDRDLHAGFANSIGLVHSITKGVEAYCMFGTLMFSDLRIEWSASLRAGLNYRVCRNIELFAGSDFGLRGSFYDFAPFLGFSVRLP